jgi:hypothetical protein
MKQKLRLFIFTFPRAIFILPNVLSTILFPQIVDQKNTFSFIALRTHQQLPGKRIIN